MERLQGRQTHRGHVQTLPAKRRTAVHMLHVGPRHICSTLKAAPRRTDSRRLREEVGVLEAFAGVQVTGVMT